MPPSLLITAGFTLEPIDSLMFLAQRERGRYGFDLASVAEERGHRVTLLLAGLDHELWMRSAKVHLCGSSSELRQLLLAHQADHEVILLTAAIPTWRPILVEDQRVEAEAGSDTVMIELKKTSDPAAGLVASKRPGQKLIVLRQGVGPTGAPSTGIDAEIWQNPAPDSPSVEPTWRDAKGSESPGRIPYEQWAGWVLGHLK